MLRFTVILLIKQGNNDNRRDEMTKTIYQHKLTTTTPGASRATGDKA